MTRVLLALSLATLLVGCGKKKKKPPSANWESTPHLPSPTAGTYQRLPAVPVDKALATVVKGKQWDTSLSGAAAGLALGVLEGSGALETWQIREALWQAGYPYPASQAKGWSVAQAAPPPIDVQDWLNAQPEGADIGLVRARSPQGDAWVGLVARPRGSVGALPRRVDIGGQITLPAIEGGEYRLADADGQLHTGTLTAPKTFTLAQAGEWLVEVRDKRGVIALFPVYAGVGIPEETVIQAPEQPLASAEEAQTRAVALFQRIREVYEVEPWTADLVLTTHATDALASGKRDRPGMLSCDARTVEDCVDRILWNPDARRWLLDPAVQYAGIAARLDVDGVHIVALVGGDDG